MTRRPMTLRTRLSLILVTAVAAGAITFAFAARAAVDHVLHDEVDRDLRVEVARTLRTTDGPSFEGVLREGGARNRLRPGRPMRGAQGARVAGEPGAVFGPGALVAQVVDEDGDVIVRTSSVDAVGGLPQPDDLTADDGLQLRTIRLGGAAFRLGEARGEDGGLVQIARPIDDVGDFLDTLMWVLVVGGLLAAGAAVLLARWAARATLEPIGAMTDTAHRIAQDPGELAGTRVEPAFADPELQVFAEAMNDMLDSIADADQRQRRFVADASHELRTPLTSLTGNATYIDRTATGLDGDAREALDAVQRDVDRLLRIADGLTVLARLDAPGTLQLEPVDVDAVAHDAVARARSLHPGHEFSVDGAVGTVVLDEELLRRIVGNLVDNAGRYTPAGTAVHVALTASDRGVEIVVSDDGPGLADEERELVLQRFHRGSTAAGVAGTGLGLAIVAESALALGGTLHLEAADPTGLRCVVRLDAGSVDSTAG